MRTRTLTALLVLAALLFCTTHTQPTRAVEPLTTAIIIAAVFFLLEQAVNVATLPDNEPAVGPITVTTNNAGSWYVGDTREIFVRFEASFGNIRGKNQVGRLKVQVLLGNTVMDEEVRKYTVKQDNKPSTKTLGGREGEFEFKLKLQAAKVAQNEMLLARVIACGEKGTAFKKDEKVCTGARFSDPFPVNFQYPFELEPASSKIGHLNPPTGSRDHNLCFDQSLQVKSLTSAEWEIIEGTIGDQRRRNFKREGTGTFTVASARVGHYEGADCGLPLVACNSHVGNQGYKTGWDLSRGSSEDNVIVYLTGGKQWLDGGDSGPSQDDNTCTGQSVLQPNCYGMNYNIVFPDPSTINKSVQLQLISFQEQPAAVGAGWGLILTTLGGNPGLPSDVLQQWTTDANGRVQVNVTNLTPVVDVYLVPPTGTQADYFDSDSLFRSAYPLDPLPDTLYILEKEGPRLSGRVIDNQTMPDDLEADVVITNPQTLEVTRIGVVGNFDLGPIGLTKLGYPTTNIQIEVQPQVNRAYTVSSISFPAQSTTGATIMLPDAVFTEASSTTDPVLFIGTVLVRNVIDRAELPLRGLDIVVDESNPPVMPFVAQGSTNSVGAFGLTVNPPGTYWVHFPNAGNLTGPNGGQLDPQALTSFQLEFGRGGPTLDIGEVVIYELFRAGIPVLFPVGLVILLALLGAAAFWVLSRRLM